MTNFEEWMVLPPRLHLRWPPPPDPQGRGPWLVKFWWRSESDEVTLLVACWAEPEAMKDLTTAFVEHLRRLRRKERRQRDNGASA
jgi:hypothetical protein